MGYMVVGGTPLYHIPGVLVESAYRPLGKGRISAKKRLFFGIFEGRKKCNRHISAKQGS